MTSLVSSSITVLCPDGDHEGCGLYQKTFLLVLLAMIRTGYDSARAQHCMHPQNRLEAAPPNVGESKAEGCLLIISCTSAARIYFISACSLQLLGSMEGLHTGGWRAILPTDLEYYNAACRLNRAHSARHRKANRLPLLYAPVASVGGGCKPKHTLLDMSQTQREITRL